LSSNDGGAVLAEWRGWWESWRLSLEAAGRRERTLQVHERELLRFGEHVGVPPLLVTRTMVREWMRDLIELGRAPHTINNRLIAVKSFYSWLTDEGEMPSSPAAGLTPPPHRGPDPDVLSDDEVNKVLGLLPATHRRGRPTRPSSVPDGRGWRIGGGWL
jgi:site-specific recombinase XerD